MSKRTARVVFSIFSLCLFLANCGDDSNPQCVMHEDCEQGYTCKESECVPVELNTESHSPGTVPTSSTDVTDGPSGTDSTTQPPPAECTPSIETCNGLDDDCDGEADEDGVCDPKECYPGEQTDCNTLMPGICEDGTAVCFDDYEFGFCLPDADPSLELCGDGLDNDCDGEADESCQCPVVGITAACDTGKPGICNTGSMYCRNTHEWGECTQVHFESPEVCGDGLDNDCDGEADEECYCTEGETLACVTGLYGACSQGQMTCTSNNTFGDCLPVTNMTAEVCGDRLDNDCDGQIDNNCACTSGTQTSCITDLPGVCSAGVATCLPDGTGYGFCVASVSPIIEVCGDGLDNDCDGSVDNGCFCDPGTFSSCVTPMLGACAWGSAECAADGMGYGFCMPTTIPIPELCDDGVDNDCDGVVDNGCTCQPGTVITCDTGLPGFCAVGNSICLDDGSGYSPCQVVNGPGDIAEMCNDGIDTDCNGLVDDGCDCVPDSIAWCNTDQDGECSNGQMVCLSSGNGYGPCETTYIPVVEVCFNGLDDDCDGLMDNGCTCVPGSSVVCNTGLFGFCGAGLQHCLNDGSGYGPCEVLFGPGDIAEVCYNGFDDDCDGQIDNGCTCVPASVAWCNTGQDGECSNGEMVCLDSGDGYGPCQPTYTTLPETCFDGVDNDCDGIVDNGCTCVAGTSLVCDTGLLGLCGVGLTTCLDDGSGYGPCEVLLGPNDVAEVCDNGLDEDCNGLVDDGCTCAPGSTAWCNTGQDGECSNGEMVCLDSGDGYGPCQPIYTTLPETCFDGVDNDCDGIVDNGCTCVAGTSLVCDTGLLGLCGVGLTTCLDDGSGYGPCEVMFGPGDVAEVCDNGLDEDCNGLVDDGCTCVPNSTAWCNTGQPGECSNGQMTCLSSGNGYGPCETTYTPLAETCFNGLDDDCDGIADENCACVAGSTVTCDTGLEGLCGIGLATCLDDGSGFGPCEVLLGPGDVAELCNDGIDQDCNGVADDGCDCVPNTTLDCNTGLPGICSSGVMTCLPSGDGWTSCEIVTPVGMIPEVCDDHIDQDCNGLVDDGCYCASGSTEWCNTGLLGNCADGLMTCLDSEDGYGPCLVQNAPAQEVCFNGVDDDCDGVVDNGCTCVAGTTMACDTGLSGLCGVGLTTCLDDGSGFGPCEVMFGPGDVAEVCDNGLDEDCNGLVDDGCTCVPNSTAWCNTGQDGECSNGQMTCLSSGNGYGPCETTYTPLAETCFNGLDDDCDGLVDNGCTCVAGTSMSCDTTLEGICGVGLTVCLDDGSGYGPCQVLIGPGDVAEICNDGIDQNCNGLVDEGCNCVPNSTLECNTGLPGVCSSGVMTCLPSGDGWTPCEVVTPVGLIAEVCDNGIDEDCNGLVDDGCTCVPNSTAWCHTGQLGQCSDGQMTCLSSGNSYGPCEVLNTPVLEVCFNGVDDDCDGVADENCACVAGSTVNCDTGLEGLCGVGLATCLDDGSDFGPCEVMFGPGDVAEVCDNGLDEDCNGLVDDGCTCVPNSTAWCNTGQPGECSNGQMTCLSSGNGYGPCETTYTPVAETCFNGLDDDCDGLVDNGCTCVAGTSMSCDTTLEGICGVGLTVCLDDGSGYGPCQVLIGPGDVAETCDNGLDEDCNGLVDDGCTCVPNSTAWCNTGQPGECSNGQMTCLSSGNGYGPCETTYTPLAETCFNGLDDDCDGVVDNGCTCVAGITMACDTDLFGLCGVGLTTCLDDGSGFGPCEVMFGPGDVAEVCDNGLDEDCNGLVDDGCTCTPASTAWCNTGQFGECSNGQMTCLSSGNGYGPCEATVTPVDEFCFDGLDNDCDGQADEDCACVPGVSVSCGTELFGVCGVGLTVCLDDGSGFGPCQVLIGPGDIAEVCNDGIDQDCNGVVDNGCDCVPNTTLDCNTGLPGICSNGVMTCFSSGDGWTSCEIVTPVGSVPEVCGDHIDQDCNGLIDDGCTCVPTSTSWCNTGMPGDCADGLMTCLDSGDGYGPCEAQNTPVAETCGDGADNDCDGLVDNGCACAAGTNIPCDTGLAGICGVGLTVCLDDGSGYGPCQVLTGPGDVAEICADGIDQNCNGIVDDGCTCVAGTVISCNTGLWGVCSVGQRTCDATGTAWGPCEVVISPGDNGESCLDSLDNDCDGAVNEGCVCDPTDPNDYLVCDTGLAGICAVGRADCIEPGDFYGQCQILIGPGDVAEVCGDGIDQNCNGLIDEGCTCVPNSVISCNTGLPGVCANGESTCLPSGDAWGLCEVLIGVGDQAEICGDLLDNNCNGIVDGVQEGCPPF